MKDTSLARLAELMGVLGVESRLRIIRLLMDQGSLCVNALACRLNISQSAVSQHLKILHYNDLVSSRRDGYYIHYELNREMLENTLELLSRLGIEDDRSAEAEHPCHTDKKDN